MLRIHLRKTCRKLRIYLIVYVFSKILNTLRIFIEIDIINIILIINIVYDHRIYKVFVRIFIFFNFFFIIILFFFDFDKRLILNIFQIDKIVIFFMDNLLLENLIWFIFRFFFSSTFSKDLLFWKTFNTYWPNSNFLSMNLISSFRLSSLSSDNYSLLILSMTLRIL